MPQSKADQKLRTNEEVVNFVECGDARGSGWLQNHPDARERAEQLLERITGRAEEPLTT